MTGWFKSACPHSAFESCFKYHEGSHNVNTFVQRLTICTVEVTGLCIYRAPVQKLGFAMGVLGPDHHFLVMEVSEGWHPDGRHLNGMLIKAEKFGPDDDGTGTGIKVRNVPLVDDGAEVHHRTEGDMPRVRIPMARLLEILTAQSCDYNLVLDNCWKYAHAICTALLEGFRALVPEQHRGLFTKPLEQMPPLVMPLERPEAHIACAAVVLGVVTVCALAVGAIFGGEDEDEESSVADPE